MVFVKFSYFALSAFKISNNFITVVFKKPPIRYTLTQGCESSQGVSEIQTKQLFNNSKSYVYVHPLLTCK